MKLMVIDIIQDWIWNIGGFLFTTSIFLLIIAYIISLSLNRLSGWHNKENRHNLVYWIRNKERLNEIIEEEKKRGS